MSHDLVYLDFESYYARDYSLKKLTPAEYILDPRFETICMGVAINGEPVDLIDGPDCAAWFAARDPQKTTMLTYNALFDQSVAAWRFGFVPARMVDVLGMARALLGYRLHRLSLASVADALGLGKKGETLAAVIGMRRADIMAQPELWKAFGEYCCNDVELLRQIYAKLNLDFPPLEYDVMDLVLRACVQPSFHCDVELLREHVSNIRAHKEALVAKVGGDASVISGNGSFVKLLEAQGVEIQMKPGKRGEIPATAKTDAFMVELLEHENPEVQALAAARLGVKSTLEERRSERLIAIAELPWPDSARLMPVPLRYCGKPAPLLPVPLRYCGAHTWRLSGDWSINLQNLPSARMGDPVLRKSLRAPDGYKVVVGDLAQIEARLVASLSGCMLLLDEFAEKRDPYSLLATDIFGVKVDKTTMDGVARHIGKAGVLGCGYGMGSKKFYDSVLRQGRSMLKPAQMQKLTEIWTTDLAEESVKAYRSRYSEVRNLWATLKLCLEGAWIGKRDVAPRRVGPVTIDNHNGYGRVTGPGGREIRYCEPKTAPKVDDPGIAELWYFSAGIPRRMYGAALTENVIQFLARIILFDAAVRLNKQGLRMIHQVHDELVFIVPDAQVEWAEDLIRTEMTRPPVWAAWLPLDTDIGHGQTYGDA